MRIKEILKTKGLSVNELAEMLGVSRVSVSNMINGNPTVETLNRIAGALGVSVSELFAAPAEGVITCPHCGKSIALHPSGVGGCSASPASEG